MDETKIKHYKELSEWRKKDPVGYQKDLEEYIELLGEPTEETLERLKRIPKRSKANGIQN